MELRSGHRRHRRRRARDAGLRLIVERVEWQPAALDHDREDEEGGDRRSAPPRREGACPSSPPALPASGGRDRSLCAGAGEEREPQRREGDEPPRDPDRVPSGEQLVDDPVGPQPPTPGGESECEHRDRHHPDPEADPNPARVGGGREAGERQCEDHQTWEERLLGDVRESVPERRGGAAPDEVLLGGDEEDIRRARERLDLGRRAARAGMGVCDPDVWAAEREAADDEDHRPGHGRDREPAIEPWPVPPQPDDRRHGAERRQQVGERQSEREPDRELPGGDHPAGDHPPRAAEPVAANSERRPSRTAFASSGFWWSVKYCHGVLAPHSSPMNSMGVNGEVSTSAAPT